MKIAHTGVKHVITNAARTKFFAFGPDKRYSDTVDNLLGAELFKTAAEARHVIATGRGGHWGAIDNDQLYEVIPVNVAVAMEAPTPVVAHV